jgi:hypothetical protein
MLHQQMRTHDRREYQQLAECELHCMWRFLTPLGGLAMFSRRQFAVAGASLGAVAAMSQVHAADDASHAGAMPSTEMQSCAKACSDCQRMCNSCSTHCAHQVHAGKAEHIKTLMTCQDCADVCAAASQVVARGGPYSEVVCKACADVCAKCAEACEAFPEDAHMKACAAECRACEKACQAMVS